MNKTTEVIVQLLGISVGIGTSISNMTATLKQTLKGPCSGNNISGHRPEEKICAQCSNKTCYQ